ncbi:MAG: peptidoglycan editing factor PgeF [Micavibrio sp.]|nr:peptidoglycan editing factor PgeF [Micavibrio sp.]
MKFLTTDLDDFKWLKHGFFTRVGGMSGGIYGTLNCAFGSDDKADSVAANRGKVAETLDLTPENIVTVKQVHSNKVITVEAPWPRERAPEADALVTKQKGIGLGILTADCAPVLFAAKKSRVIGAAHAGWKGAIGGVLEATIAAMAALGAEAGDITAAIGPCIGPQSYEVSEDFIKPFLAQDEANAKFFKPGAREGHLIFDLPGYAAQRLAAAGIKKIIDTRQDTLTNEAAYFSYRRSTIRKEPDYGRQMSLITIR